MQPLARMILGVSAGWFESPSELLQVSYGAMTPIDIVVDAKDVYHGLCRLDAMNVPIVCMESLAIAA